ncbi:Piwi-like protein Siwi [Frankliniella fusca]|uniref:Piwi-like protein Siwi n=1 Tax=Frankliniella fusca TaxID=407009 RepID=A0AAE1I167_9NEOP|nr:Piwi-like protein Siwi [Frankliniella fusca]
MSGKGRGRGKTRDAAAAAQTAPAQTGAPRAPSYAQMGGGVGAGAPQPPTTRAPAAGAWGPPPGASSRATHRAAVSQPGDLAGPMGRMDLGAAAPRGPPPGNGNGNGNGGHAPVGRGAMRGGRQIDLPSKLLVTKPASLQTKKGLIEGKAYEQKFMANYFRIQTVPGWVLHQYRVDIAPDEDRTSTRRFLLRAHRQLLRGYLFDGTVLYTAERLTTPQNPQITLTSEDPRSGTVYTITIRHVNQVDVGDYAYVQVYNLLLRACIFALDLKLVGRDYYDAVAKIEVPEHRLELWPGYKTSIRQHERDILMCCEITFKVMRMETVYDILRNCQQQSQDYRNAFAREVIGCIVLTKYNNKTYRIDDIDWDKNPAHKFRFRDAEISFAEYMKSKYQIEIRDLKQPLLVSKAKARDIRAGMAEVINLIPEVCYLTGLTDAMRENFRLMAALAVHTRVDPPRRIAKLMQFNQRLLNDANAVAKLKDFDMTLERNLVQITGRVETTEDIVFGNGRSVSAGDKVDWTRSFRNIQLLNTKSLTNWVVLVSGRDMQNAMSFVTALQKAASGIQFQIGKPQMVEMRSGNAAEYPQLLGKVLDSGSPQLIMCAVGGKRVDVYSAIKKKCCIDRAVPTQVMVAKNLNNPKSQMSIATKVAIQMCCKIGGAPWTVQVPINELMVVGFDVCHDTADKSKSFGAMVASLDKAMSRYYSSVTPHTSGQELSTNLALSLSQAVCKFREVNGGKLPSRIIMYRDGVGEGQIRQVLEVEVKNVKEALEKLYGGQPMKLCYIIVTKRINTRIFTANQQNAPPGSVVDDVITDPEKYDFFLVSQSVNQGTVSPTSYNVIEDTVGLPAGKLQRLTYKMCHMYFNWSGTVRVPAPCQYAHKLAFLVGQAIHRQPRDELSDLLYFL